MKVNVKAVETKTETTETKKDAEVKTNVVKIKTNVKASQRVGYYYY